MALIRACVIGNAVKNTGIECSVAMGATAMMFAVPPSTVITEDDLADPLGWARINMHGPKATRIYPLFGSRAPIQQITDNNESDVEVTMDDGTKIKVRLGVYNREFQTTAGGLCYAESLLSFVGCGYSIIEIDQSGKMLLRKNEDGETYGGLLTSFVGGGAPQLANLKDVYRNKFGYSFTPQELVNRGTIFTGAGALLGLNGLIDAEILPGDQVQTTTTLFIKVRTECAQSNLIALIGANLGTHVNNFVVTAADGTIITPSAAAIIGGEVRLTGVFPAGDYTVEGSSPVNWFNNSVFGYDAEDSIATVTVPA